MRAIHTLLFLPILLLFGGCASYTVPGAPADLSKLGVDAQKRAALTDFSVRQELAKQPVATFPVAIAIVRVQAPDYASDSYPGNPRYRGSAYSVVTVNDVEKEEDLEKLAKLPQITGIAPIKRILLDRALNTDLELREAAAKLHAGMLLFYTFDTQFHTDHHAVPLGVITLGLFPTRVEKVTCTASAVLMDVANGYVYNVAEATSASGQIANDWSSDQAAEEVRRKVERQAFVDMLDQFRGEWPTVVATYDHPAASARAPLPARE
ncbi:MAG TPA: hypothetical protein VHQ47_13680 [Phycisphaerae bacterium]|nr:hypothetical protein [Phycisphaerae bacterium]